MLLFSGVKFPSMSDENFLPDAFSCQLCQWEYSHGAVLPRGLRQVATPVQDQWREGDLTLNDYCLVNSLFMFPLGQFVHLGEDDDGEISSWRDQREGRGLRGRGQDGRRPLLLLLIQVGSSSPHWSVLEALMHKCITNYKFIPSQFADYTLIFHIYMRHFRLFMDPLSPENLDNVGKNLLRVQTQIWNSFLR